MVGIVETYKDAHDIYDKNQTPKYLRIEEKKFEFKVQIKNQCIKMYVTKEMEMFNNINSSYAKIWGQCTDTLQNMIKHLDKFTVKNNERAVIWLPKNIKTVSTGI